MQLGVGAAIRNHRKARGWSQAELGKHAGGINVETVKRAELGANVTVDTLLKITHALELELEIALVESGARKDVLRSDVGVAGPAIAPSHATQAPGKDALEVPTPEHRILMTAIAALPLDDVLDILPTVIDRVRRRHGAAREHETPSGTR